MFKSVDNNLILDQNKKQNSNLDRDYEYFLNRIERININYKDIEKKISNFNVALPSWGVGTGGTRFFRFPGIGEPQNIYEKIEDCAVINDLVGITSTVSPHFPWDNVEDYKELKEFTEDYGLGFDIVNSNTFQDPQKNNHPKNSIESFKFGSLSHSS